MYFMVELGIALLVKLKGTKQWLPTHLRFTSQGWWNWNQGSISSTFNEQLLCSQIPKVQKRQSNHQSFFALSGSVRAKATRRMLVKLTPDLQKKDWKKIIGHLVWRFINLLHYKWDDGRILGTLIRHSSIHDGTDRCQFHQKFWTAFLCKSVLRNF